VTTVPVETVTRWVQKDSAGRVVAVTNELGARQLGGEAETLTVPTEEAVRARLAEIGVTNARRCDDIKTWSVSTTSNVTDDRNSWAVADEIQRSTGWPASVAPSGSCVYVWPTAS
jgi:hypothetical protein